jgi:hypothetical protein
MSMPMCEDGLFDALVVCLDLERGQHSPKLHRQESTSGRPIMSESEERNRYSAGFEQNCIIAHNGMKLARAYITN